MFGRAGGNGSEHPQNVNDTVATFARSQLKNTGEGKVLYQQGIKNDWNWRPMCYASQNFRAYYTLQLFNARSALILEAIHKAIEEDYVTRRFFKTVETAVSLGCGPGSDLSALKTFLAETFPYSSSKRSSPHFVGYDVELGWMPYLLNLGFDFESVEVNKDFLHNMKKVDVILMSYCTKELCRDFADGDEQSSLWKVLKEKARFVVVMDAAESSQFPPDKEYKQFTLTDILGNNATIYCSYAA